MSAANKTFTLVIDAGHGGHDAGAVGRFAYEKTINLKTALAFGNYVERNCPDVKVVYTRKTDKFLPLYARAQVANKHKADLFISIHTNALPKGRIARGLETYTLGMHRADDNLEVAKRENDVILLESDHNERYQGFNPNSSESYIIFEFMQDKNMEHSVEMARLIQKRTCSSANRHNMGVKQAGFLVLRETSMPSCLVELGFISTPDEERFLASAAGIDKMAIGLYRAFAEYKKKYYGGESYPQIAHEQTETPVETATTTPEEHHTPTVTEDTKPTVTQLTAQEEPAVAPSQQSKPIFKVQVMASNVRIKAGDKRLKGRTDMECYEENGMFKYTIGASDDYNKINSLRRQLSKTFKQAFTVAFKDGRRMDINEAIREFKRNK